MSFGKEVPMGTRRNTILVSVILGLGLALASRGAAPASEVGELKVTIHEWDVPTKGAHPHDPAVGPDGALWFTEQMANKLGQLDPKSGAFKEYPLKVEDSGPHGLVADRDGNIWFTGNFKGYVGKLDPRTGAVTEFKIPDPKGEDPHTAVFDSQGMLWFTLQVANMVGRLDPRTGKIDLKKVQTANSHPYGIAINSKGFPIFCEFATNKMAKIDPQSMEITEYMLPEGVRPRRMAIDAGDLVYFTDYSEGHLGRLDMASGAVKMWASPSGAKSAPYGITITPDGMVWYSESGVKPNTIVRFDPKTESFARASIPSGGGTVRNMAATSDGRVYIACSGVNKVGVVEPAR
ncbi:MAG: lyase [Acidobacteria bacterium]|nr:MAG: lyase [Acidobacteriota bacterium]